MIDYGKIARKYASHRKIHPEVLQGIMSKARISEQSRVLEVGCGSGNYISAIRETIGCTCSGIDPSESMLAIAKSKSKGTTFCQGRAEELPFQNGFFDLVFSVDVIHHIHDMQRYCKEAHRVLKKGGRICTVTDSEWIIRHREPLSEYFPETVDVELSRYPKIGELKRSMKRAGFSRTFENNAEHRYMLTDSEPYKEKVFSSLHLIPDEAFKRGLEAMQMDLEKAPIQCTSRYLMLWGEK